MKIHEYQAKELFRAWNIPVPDGVRADTPEQAEKAARDIGRPVVVKAQIHAGGRGKGGGIKLAPTPEDARKHAQNIIGMNLVTHQTGPEGRTVKTVLVEEALDIAHEFYAGMAVDRKNACVSAIVSTEGGVEIEAVAEKTPELIHTLRIDPSAGMQPYMARSLAFRLGMEKKMVSACTGLIMNLYRLFRETDASLAEINPLAVTKDGRFLAADAKINFDDNAVPRHKQIAGLRDLSEEEPAEIEAAAQHLSYVKLDGTVGCMVNGAGLAMATMDIIKLHGGMPANFLDVGGGASPERVEHAFRILMSDANVKAVLINIFGGIVRCDRVANGVVSAAKKLNINVPIVVRLAGTNSELAGRILEDSGLTFQVASNLREAADMAVAAVRSVK